MRYVILSIKRLLYCIVLSPISYKLIEPCEIVFRFSTPLAFRALWFKNRVKTQKSKTTLHSSDVWVFMRLIGFSYGFSLGFKLFTNIKYNKQHVLHSLLPSTMDTKYYLRPRPHNFKLTTKNCSITECDFISLLGCFLKTFIDFMFFFHVYFMY